MDSALRAMAAQQPPVEAELPSLADLSDAGAPEAPSPGGRPLFAADRAGSDDLGRAGEAAFLAELILHKQAQTPFCIALLGAAGAGKTAFLEATLAAVQNLADKAAAVPVGPFCADVVTVRVDAAGAGEPAAALLQAVTGRLAETHPALAADLVHAGDDPAEAVRNAEATLDGARRRLDAERQALGEVAGREARLAEAALDAPGSLVDSFARANRARLDRILGGFGFAGTDPVATYKDLVREAAEGSSPLGRAGLVLRALWAFKGQTRLLVGAVVLFALAWALGAIRAGQGGAPADTGDKAAPVADWLQAHLGWLSAAETGLLLLGMLLLLIDVMRAARFVFPVARGVDLLQQDIDARRRDVTSQLAHQTRRVDAVTAEVEAAARAAGEAERRAAGRTGPAAARAHATSGSPEAVFRLLQTMMADTGAATRAPRRIVVAVDGLDQRSAEEAARLVAAANRMLGQGGVAIVVAQQSHLMAGFGETDPARATAQFARCIHLPYRIGAADASDVARRAYAVTLMDAAPARVPPIEADATRSALDAPWRPREAETVAALAPFAGDTPRLIKRFVNLYRVARADPRLREAPSPVFTALALALALDAHGFPDDLSALERASHGEAPGEATILRKALAVAREASGQPVELGQAQRALDVAESYTGRL